MTSLLFEKVMDANISKTLHRITLADFFQSAMNNPSVRFYTTSSLQNLVINALMQYDDYSCEIRMGCNNSSYDLIIADNSDGDNKKKMTVLTAERFDSELIELDISKVNSDMIIDLNRGGRRWEGCELNGKPFGFGREYSENDNLVYEGFVFNNQHVCVGMEFCNQSNNPCMYKGGYLNGQRCGIGTSYDLNGNVDYEGEWMNNHGLTEHDKTVKNNLILPSSTEEFIVEDGIFNNENITTLRFSPLLTQLNHITIGENGCKHVHEFVVDGLPNLQSVKVGENSFKLNWNKHAGSLCRFANCPKLRELMIDSNSFYYHQSLELINLDSLQIIQFGRSCFGSDCILKGR